MHVSQTIDGQRICDVMDTTRGESSPRQFKTNRELSLHTDPVSDLIGLACLRPAQSGGESVLVSAVTVYNQMLERDADLLEALFEGFRVHRYGEGRPEDPRSHRISGAGVRDARWRAGLPLCATDHRRGPESLWRTAHRAPDRGHGSV